MKSVCLLVVQMLAFRAVAQQCLDPEDDAWSYDAECPTCTSASSCADLEWQQPNNGRGSSDICAQSKLLHDGEAALTRETCAGADQSVTDGWEHALAICVGAGARLCTVAELKGQEAKGTGCSHDAEQTWTSTPCDACGGKMSAKGLNGNKEEWG